MKKILMSAFAVAAVAAVAGVGSYAAWTSTKSASGSIQSGYMELLLDDEEIVISNVAPGDSGTVTREVTNDSNAVNGVVEVSFEGLIDYENYCVEPENNEGGDTTCTLNGAAAKAIQDPSQFVGPGNGELSEHIMIDSVDITRFDGSTSSTETFVNPLPDKSLKALVDSGITPSAELGEGETVEVTVHWSLPESSNDNVYMTDAVVVNLVATLTQNVDNQVHNN